MAKRNYYPLATVAIKKKCLPLTQSYCGERFQVPTRHSGEYKVDLTRHPKFSLAFDELASGRFPHCSNISLRHMSLLSNSSLPVTLKISQFLNDCFLMRKAI